MGCYRSTSWSEDSREAHAIYSSISEWAKAYPKWILGVNETRETIDRDKPESKLHKKKYKFVDSFLDNTNGIDVWRSLYPQAPGFTYRNEQKGSRSRIDYFLISSTLSQINNCLRMSADWEPSRKDHCKISHLNLPEASGCQDQFG